MWTITNCRDGNRTANYTYDTLNRITTAYTNGPNWGESFVIDPWGNLTNINSYAGKNLPRGLSAAPASTKNQLNGYCHDAAGNLGLNAPCPGDGLVPQVRVRRLDANLGATAPTPAEPRQPPQTCQSSSIP